jgi:hypothetical protein
MLRNGSKLPRVGATRKNIGLTTNNYYTLPDLHNLQSVHTNLPSLFPLAFSIRLLATDL